jgi:hypothetical protein
VKLDPAFEQDPNAGADGLHDLFFTAFNDIVSSQYTLYQTEIRWNDGVTLDLRVALNVEPKPFIGNGPALPQNTAGLIKKLSAIAGRRNRGRFYLPGMNESDIDTIGGISSALQGAINTKLGTWLTNIETVTLGAFDGMFILHSTGISGAPPPTKVTQLVVDPKVATQRTRLRR